MAIVLLGISEQKRQLILSALDHTLGMTHVEVGDHAHSRKCWEELAVLRSEIAVASADPRAEEGT